MARPHLCAICHQVGYLRQQQRSDWFLTCVLSRTETLSPGTLDLPLPHGRSFLSQGSPPLPTRGPFSPACIFCRCDFPATILGLPFTRSGSFSSPGSVFLFAFSALAH